MKFYALLLTLSAVHAAVNTAGDDFPLFEINLDLPPRQRFKQVATHFRSDIITTVDTLMEEFSDLVKPALAFFDMTSWVWRFT
jgi:hypothetical protein